MWPLASRIVLSAVVRPHTSTAKSICANTQTAVTAWVGPQKFISNQSWNFLLQASISCRWKQKDKTSGLGSKILEQKEEYNCMCDLYAVS